MKHVKTIVSGKEITNTKDVNYAVSCKTSVTLGSNFNVERKINK